MRWNPTVHAIQRLKERFGVNPEGALNYVNQAMAQAKYVSAGKADKLVYYYEKRDMMIVVNPEENVVVTVHPATEQAPVKADTSATANPTKITVNWLADAVQRQYKRMSTQIKREVRKMTEQAAQMQVEIAQLNVNKIRCKHPKTQTLIQSRIDELSAKVDELAATIDAKLTQVQQASEEVKAVTGE